MYSKLKNIELHGLKTPKNFVPSPTQNDYQLGFIRRYFLSRVSDKAGFVYEVSPEEYDNYLENPHFLKADVKWRISGPIEPTYKQSGEVEDRGVRNSNKAALGLLSNKLKNIALYLPNLLQFYK